uniref:Ankyrin repeat and MYND domain-containing protein 2 n=1 Tax=Molossus molossus TaxID=27622 RepID=A0A7J8HB18_MOLMO|nr:ankyrin repeat and MYND domain containing 2 [Molossus molossus]
MVHIKKGELSQEEKALLEVIGKGTIQEAGTLLASKNVRVNCLDENGMTPLMHAAYKGKLDMCKLLLRHGADVNCHQHEHGYTALMFAALSGNKDITWAMLEAGAETDVVNSVGRTAAQMAAFVGQHDCVTVINNFFPRERLNYYTKPQGLDTEPKLPPKLAGPLHKIITTTNLHPVKGSDPTAFSVLTQAITGQVGFVDVEFCTTCGEKGASKRCSVCKMVIYCDQSCQKTHWFAHKKICKNLKDIYEKQQLEAAKEKSEEDNNGKLDVSSNGIDAEQPEAEPAVPREGADPPEAVEGEKASLQCHAGLECSQDAAAGPLASEE